MAESEGFEPPDAFASTVFKTAAFDLSANFPHKIICNLRLSVFYMLACLQKIVKFILPN